MCNFFSGKPLFVKDLISGVAASGQSASYWLLAGKSWMYVSAWKPLAESGRKHPLCREDLDGQCREVVFYRFVDTRDGRPAPTHPVKMIKTAGKLRGKT